MLICLQRHSPGMKQETWIPVIQGGHPTGYKLSRSAVVKKMRTIGEQKSCSGHRGYCEKPLRPWNEEDLSGRIDRANNQYCCNRPPSIFGQGSAWRRARCDIEHNHLAVPVSKHPGVAEFQSSCARQPCSGALNSSPSSPPSDLSANP